METTFARSGRSYLSQNATEFIVCTISKMAETNNEFNSSLFMEEVQLYECLYNKHCRDYKNKFIRLNCWKKIAEKFNIDAAEAEKKYKNIRTAYGRYLRKKKSIPSGSGRDVAPIPSEFANLDWLVTHINQRANTMTNISLLKRAKELKKKAAQLYFFPTIGAIIWKYEIVWIVRIVRIVSKSWKRLGRLGRSGRLYGNQPLEFNGYTQRISTRNNMAKIKVGSLKLLYLEK